MADSRFKIPQLPQITTNSLLGRDTAGDGDLEVIGVSGGIEFTGSGGIQISAFTGDATKTAGGTALTLATVNSNVGSFGSATQIGQFTVNAKGLITAASNTAISIPSTQVSDFTEAVQDILAGISVDSNTLDWTYNDPSNTLTAEVKTQMSLTSDASGIKLSGDSSSPGNNQFYGTNGSGVKGWYAVTSGVTDHGALTGLTDDDHTIYALLAGRSGGQTLIGGTAASNALTLNSTSNATKGLVALNTGGGDVTIGGGATASQLRLLEPSGSGTSYVAFVSPALAANITYTLPTADAAGVFKSNGSGTMSVAKVAVSDLATGTDGELITWDASGNPATVAVGTAGHVLTSNGSGAAPTFQAPAGGGSSSGATGSIQFSNGSGGFSSDTSNLFWDDTNNMLEIAGNTGSNYGILMTGTGYGISIAPPGTQTGALNAVNVVGDYTGLITNNITNTNTTTGGAKLQLSVATSSTGDPYVAMTVGDQNYVFGIDNSDANNIFVIGQGTSPSGITTPNFALNGFLTGVGGVTNPTSKLHLPAGTATANTSPLKFTSGTALTTPEDGAVEYHGSHLYFTIGSTRYQLDQQSGGSTSWADLTSGTQTGSLTATLATNETFAMNYAGGAFAFYADDATSTFKAFSKNQSHSIDVNNSDIRIISGTSRLQYAGGSLRIYDSDATHYVSIQTAATGTLTTNLSLTLPSTTGSSNNVLVTDGAGTLSWADANTISGDVDGPAGAVDSEIVLFSGISGKVIKRATGSGLVTATAGVYGTVTAPTGNIVGTTETQTLTNKRIDPRVTSTASNTAPTPDVSTTDIYIITALAGNCTLGVPTGTPVQGTKLIYRIKDSGTARTLAYNAIYRAMGITLPTTTVISKTLYLGCIYNSTDTKWDIVAVNMEA